MKRARGGPPSVAPRSSSGGGARKIPRVPRSRSGSSSGSGSGSSSGSSDTTGPMSPWNIGMNLDVGKISAEEVQKRMKQKTRREMMAEPSGYIPSFEDQIQSLQDTHRQRSGEQKTFYDPDETDMFERMAEGKLTLDEAMGRTPLEVRRQRENDKLDLVRYKLESDQDLDDQEKFMLRDALEAARRDVYGRIIRNKEDYNRWQKYLWNK